MGHRETYEHYYRGMGPGSSHEDAYHMQDAYSAEAQEDLARHDAEWPMGYGVFTEAQALTRIGFTAEQAQRIIDEKLDVDAEFNRLFPPGSKAEHDLVGCAQLYDERCWYCQPETLRERAARFKRLAERELELAVGRAHYRADQAREAFMRRLDLTLGNISHRLAPTWDFSDGKQRQAGPFPWYRQVPADVFSRAQQVVARQRHHFDDGEIPF